MLARTATVLSVAAGAAGAAHATGCDQAHAPANALYPVCMDAAALAVHDAASRAFEAAIMLNAGVDDPGLAEGDEVNARLLEMDIQWFAATAAECRQAMDGHAPGAPQGTAYSRCAERAAQARLGAYQDEIARIERTK